MRPSARPGGAVSGYGAGGGRWRKALKQGKQHSGWSSMQSAHSPGGTSIGGPPGWRLAFCGGASGAWGTKAPALTVSQLRMLVDVGVPGRLYRVADVLT